MKQRLAAILLAGVTALCAVAAAPASAQDLASYVDKIRRMPAAANAAEVGAQRVELNAAWRTFGNYREDSIPLLRRELALEVRAARPSPQFLLEAAYFLTVYGDDSDKPLAAQAALAIPPGAALDGPQLFRLLHAVAAGKDVRLLPLIDSAFLRASVALPLPQQGSQIDDAGLRVLLYGRFGAAGERHLAAVLRDESVVKQALDVLLLVGGPDSVAGVLPLLQSADMEVFTRAVNFLLRAGGPEGRQVLLTFKRPELPPEGVEFFVPIREQLARQPVTPRGQGAIPDAEVRRQLDALEASDGSYGDTNPAAIIQSNLPKQELMERLTRIRERSFARATNEALAEIETTNALLNAVRYRDQ
ncbi:hypothetical protein [Pseudoduganella sp. OTU4001]|uniref:hypothetical protein n=1 Tax=Pseudoduganella sp. OTU4001 TaxID=3043854 RepID=UPI00313AF433